VTRLNLLLLAAVVACALGVITSQDRARRLFADIDAEREAAKRLDEEWTQLQLEQATWATHKRVEDVASRQLGMRLAGPDTTVIIDPAGVPVARAPERP